MAFLRASASFACAEANCACRAATWLLTSCGSMVASSWPFRTTMPSSTNRCAIRPPTFDLISTFLSGSMVPFSTTLISTSPREAVSLRSVLGAGLSSARALRNKSMPTTTSGSPQPNSIFLPMRCTRLQPEKCVCSCRSIPGARSHPQRLRRRLTAGFASLPALIHFPIIPQLFAFCLDALRVLCSYFHHESLRDRIGLRRAGAGLRSLARPAAQPAPDYGTGRLRTAGEHGPAHHGPGLDLHDDRQRSRHAGHLRLSQPPRPVVRGPGVRQQQAGARAGALGRAGGTWEAEHRARGPADLSASPDLRPACLRLPGARYQQRLHLPLRAERGNPAGRRGVSAGYPRVPHRGQGAPAGRHLYDDRAAFCPGAPSADHEALGFLHHGRDGTGSHPPCVLEIYGP